MDQHQAAPDDVSRRGERRLTRSLTGTEPGLEEQVGFLLRLAHQRANANLAEGIATHDLTPVQFAIILRLYERGTMSQNELGRSVGMPPANIHAMARRLVDNGLLTTTPSASDRRMLLVELTAQGRGVLEQVLPDASAANARTLSALTAAERAAFLKLLAKLQS